MQFNSSVVFSILMRTLLYRQTLGLLLQYEPIRNWCPCHPGAPESINVRACADERHTKVCSRELGPRGQSYEFTPVSRVWGSGRREGKGLFGKDWGKVVLFAVAKEYGLATMAILPAESMAIIKRKSAT
ncbi:hypothetical protein M406DRAFT_75570 [Cryphonectria parasitica EP155]|uniref:Uncharacterized protein n=1 Tax=Cryphonectria parasitica (strain ATCC 38755 / EP155) TaxID=660469 RepID=A0A9P4XS09_CRYP1|nr:uncharacterized protein M406DRAFT_75570 [Cryphonectria parasitica EP155]KAF3760267.1 hypothetical protein M406DRAFT_75570 [Cryphonectria parasitica EP155]